jgi:hypothetical protein
VRCAEPASCRVGLITPAKVALADSDDSLSRITMVIGRSDDVEQILAPPSNTGDIEDVGVHRVAGVRDAIGARGAVLFNCPLYRPASTDRAIPLKAVLREAAARSIESCGRLLADCSPCECATYPVNTGYGQLIVKCSSDPRSRH